jgi:uncharacterized BrkB/YihY/UPF0761 family membrane protein
VKSDVPGTTESGKAGRVKGAAAWTHAASEAVHERALQARESHATVDVGFRVATLDRRAAAMVLAGGIAYRVFFWLLALSVLLGGVLGLFQANGVETELRDHGYAVWAASAVADFTRSADGNEWWLLLVGSWLLLWTGYTCTKALVLAHAAVWDLHPPAVKKPLRASLIFSGCVLCFIAALAGARWLREEGGALGLAATMLVLVIPFGFWLVLSRALPNRAARWLELAPGAALFSVGMQAMHLFTVYFLSAKLGNATELYGILGIVTTILFWFYLAGRLVIAAATLNASVVDERRERLERSAEISS